METEITNNQTAKKNSKHFKIFVVIVLICVSFFAGTFYNKYRSSKSASSSTIENLLVKSNDKDQPKNVDFSLFWEAWNLLNEKYVDTTKLDQQKMIYGAISGMVKAVGDPFSSFMDPAGKPAIFPRTRRDI